MWLNLKELNSEYVQKNNLNDKYCTYAFVFRIESQFTCTIGKLGTHRIFSGFYVYVGSARNGILNRVQRHVRKNKTVRWHIDYLTISEQCQPCGALMLSRHSECALNKKVSLFPGAHITIKGFGASDCTEQCEAHLHYFELNPEMLLKQLSE